VKRLGLLGAVVAAALLVPAASAAADDSFDGSCDPITGSAKFDTPLSSTEADNGYHFTGTGSCTGTLNGAAVTDTPITAQVDGKFHGSCSGSKSTDNGPGKLVFTKGTPAAGDDVTVTFTMTFTGTASEVDFVLKGTKSGEATGHASFLTTRTPPDLVVKCESGGNAELPFDATSKTSSPLTSASPQAQAASKPSGGSSGSGSGSGSSSGSSPAPASGGESGGGGAAAQGASEPSLEIATQKLAAVLKSGLRVTCRAAGPASCSLKLQVAKAAGKRYKLSGTVGSRGGSIASGADHVDLTAKLSAKARKRLAKAKSITITVVATVAGKSLTKTVTLRR
jgi:hypothetical protein